MVFLTPVKQANTGLTDAICRVEPLGSLPIRALALPLRRIARRLRRNSRCSRSASTCPAATACSRPVAAGAPNNTGSF